LSAGREKYVKIWFAALLAIGISLPGAALAGGGEGVFVWSPRYLGKFADYFPAAQTHLPGVTAKNGRVVKRCPAVGKRRGARLKVQNVPAGQPNTSGFFSVFPDGDQVRPPSSFIFIIDVERLTNVDSRAAIELDTPFVAVGGTPTHFLSYVVNREADDSLQVFLATDGGNVGTPVILPADTPGVVGELDFANDTINATVASCTGSPPLTSIGTDIPFVFDTSFGVGAGLTGQKGDEAGIFLSISGDLHSDEARRTLLDEVEAVILLEYAAGNELASSMPAEARVKIEQARALIEDQGPEVDPPTIPATFRPSLVQVVGALPESDARKEALKRLGKAATRDAKARDAIDVGTEAALAKALKELEKAITEKVRAKAVLETGVAAEAKF
jgi:hypothetical protein